MCSSSATSASFHSSCYTWVLRRWESGRRSVGGYWDSGVGSPNFFFSIQHRSYQEPGSKVVPRLRKEAKLCKIPSNTSLVYPFLQSMIILFTGVATLSRHTKHYDSARVGGRSRVRSPALQRQLWTSVCLHRHWTRGRCRLGQHYRRYVRLLFPFFCFKSSSMWRWTKT